MIFLASVTVVEVLKWIGYVLVALLCLMLMIIIHETGHYVVGKLFHFKILEFSIGFGPKIFQKENKETGELFSLRWIPLGGYCQFEGEDEDGKDNPGAFNSKPPWQRILVLIAGASMNLLSALIIVTIFFVAYGEFVPKVYQSYDYVDTQYTQQLQAEDIIYKVDGQDMYCLSNPQKLRKAITGKEDVVITVGRDGEIMDINVHLAEYRDYGYQCSFSRICW